MISWNSHYLCFKLFWFVLINFELIWPVLKALWRSLMLNLFISLGQNSALEPSRTYKMSRAFIQVGLRNDGNSFNSPALNIFSK